MPAEFVVLAKRAAHLEIFVNLVRRDHHCGARLFERTQRVADVGGAHHVCGESFQRLRIRAPHERLRGEMKNIVGLKILNGCSHRFRVTHVGNLVAHPCCEAELLE